jgi:hypothetical protein
MATTKQLTLLESSSSLQAACNNSDSFYQHRQIKRGKLLLLQVLIGAQLTRGLSSPLLAAAPALSGLVIQSFIQKTVVDIKTTDRMPKEIFDKFRHL